MKLFPAAIALLFLGCGALRGGPDPEPPVDSIRPFRIRVDDSVLSDLKERLDRTRWPNQIEGSGWDYGAKYNRLLEIESQVLRPTS